MHKTSNANTAKILSLPNQRENRQTDAVGVQLSQAIPLPRKANVVASITIELRRGGKIDTHMDGVNPGNAYRIAACMTRLLAEVLSHFERK